ncbi:MAG: cytidine deaminase [Endomicrobium sp.]|jgi:cytidine deaminase|nr:cytidine deaminase [Endomicrobium sp.]
MNSNYKELLAAAEAAAKNSYSPYSHFAVGSAVLVSDGKIYLGSNIENAAYSLTNCAERSALFNAVSNGALSNVALPGGTLSNEAFAVGKQEILALAVWTQKGGIFPCGACRQVILELAPKADIIINGVGGKITVLKVSDLMPFSFGKENLK